MTKKERRGGTCNFFITLYDQLVDFVESHSILPKEQHGLRRNHSKNSALAAMMAKIVWNASPQLREAKTLTEAKSPAKTLSVSVRHF